MTTKTLTRADLTEAVFKAVGLSRNEFGADGRGHARRGLHARWPTARR